MPIEITPKSGLMVSTAADFEQGGQELFNREAALRLQVASSSTDAKTLAAYQAVTSEVSVLRGAQSSTVKALKEVCLGILSKM